MKLKNIWSKNLTFDDHQWELVKKLDDEGCEKVNLWKRLLENEKIGDWAWCELEIKMGLFYFDRT